MKQLSVLLVFVFISVAIYPQQPAYPYQLVAKGAKPEKAGTGYAFTEGSSTSPDGRVFFTDQPNDKIYIWDEKGGISLFKEGTERANGTLFDRQGNLILLPWALQLKSILSLLPQL